MPTKKPKTSADDEFDAAPYTTRKLIQNLGVEDLNLPRSMVARIAKGVMPPNTQVQKDAILAISKSATVFVNYLASHANDRATLNNKKTIQPDDVFEALKDLEFEEMVEQCQEEEKRFAAMLNNKRNDYRRRLREKEKTEAEKSGTGGENGESGPAVNGSTSHVDGEPAAKKPRLSNGAGTDANDDSMMNGMDEGDDTIDENEGDDQDEEDEVEDELSDDEVEDGGDQEQDDDTGERHEDEDEDEEGSESE